MNKRISALDKFTYDITNWLAPVIDRLKLKQDITDLEYHNIISINNPVKKGKLIYFSTPEHVNCLGPGIKSSLVMPLFKSLAIYSGLRNLRT